MEAHFLSFLVGVVSSVAGGWILLRLPGLRSKTLLMKLSGSSVFRHHVEYVFPSQSAAKDDIKKDFNESPFVWVYSVRADSFTKGKEGDFGYILQDESKDIRFLLANPLSEDEYSKATSISNPIKDRELEVNRDDYREKVILSLHLLSNAMDLRKNIKSKLHQHTAVFRFILLDTRLYLQFFSHGEWTPKRPMIRIDNESEFYSGFKRFFKKEWDKGADFFLPDS